jgi:hypothetical protein
MAFKNGVTQTEPSEWYGVQRRAVYSWFKRLETGPLDRTVQDEHRSGRPCEITKSDRSN